MRSIAKILIFVVALVALNIGCSGDDSTFVYPEGTVDPDGIIDRNSNGYLSLEGFYLCVETQTESFKDTENAPVDTTKVGDDSESFDISNFTVEIYREDDGEVAYSDSYANAQSMTEYLELRAGAYIVEVFSCRDSEIALADWDCPEYSGSQRYVVGDEKITPVEEFTCELSNVMASVVMSVDLIEKFDPSPEDSDMKLKVILSVGGNELSFDPTVDGQTGYFKAPSDEKMTVYLVGMYDVSTDESAEPSYFAIAKGDWTQEISGIKAGQYRNVSVKIDYNETGSIQIGLTITTWAYDTSIDVDIISQMLFALAEDVIYDPDNEITVDGSPVVTLGNGLSVEDTYSISSLLLDTATETYSPTYKAYITPSEGASVESVDIQIASTNSDLMVSLAEFGFAEEEYLSLYNEGVSIDAYSSNNIGDYISVTTDSETGDVVVALKYKGAVGLCDYLGVHTIKVMAVDSENRPSYTTLTLESVEAVTGNEPEVIWNDYIDEDGNVYSYNIKTRYEVFEDDTLNPKFNFSIVSKHEDGISSLVVAIDSEVLTEDILSSVGLVPEMDLIYADDTLKEKLVALKLPVGDDVLGQSSVEVDITEFMPLLAILEAGKSDFKIMVGDAYGTTEAVIMVEKK